MDASSLAALVGALQTATDLVGALLKGRVAAEVRGQVVDLQSALISVQQFALAANKAQLDLEAQVRDLRSELTSRDNWDAERPRYRLVSPWRGPAQVYALRKSVAGGDAAHFLCAHCFVNGRRAPLGPRRTGDGYYEMACPACKTAIATGLRGIGPACFAEDYLAPDGHGAPGA